MSAVDIDPQWASTDALDHDNPIASCFDTTLYPMAIGPLMPGKTFYVSLACTMNSAGVYTTREFGFFVPVTSGGVVPVDCGAGDCSVNDYPLSTPTPCLPESLRDGWIFLSRVLLLYGDDSGRELYQCLRES